MTSLPVLVLTAGLGTRLAPLTALRAKPAIPVAGEPLVRRILAWLAANGVRDAVLNLHHRPETITSVVGDGSDFGVRVRYSWEQPVVLGSAGGPRLALSIIGADTFLIVNGDTLTDVTLAPLVAAHGTSGALVTLALVPNAEPDRYGGVRVDQRGHVIEFVRRGPRAHGSSHFIGVQVVSASVFAPLESGRPASTVGGIYDGLVQNQPGAVRGYQCDARFWDVGTAADYLSTSLAFSAATRLRSQPERRVRIDPSAEVTRSVLWDDVEVGRGAVVDECIIADGVRVPAAANYRRAVLTRAPLLPPSAPGARIDGDIAVSPLTE